MLLNLSFRLNGWFLIGASGAVPLMLHLYESLLPVKVPVHLNISAILHQLFTYHHNAHGPWPFHFQSSSLEARVSPSISRAPPGRSFSHIAQTQASMGEESNDGTIPGPKRALESIVAF